MVVKYSLLTRMRNYQRFKGNNRFYCWGRLMSARQAGILIFCCVTIIVMACLFFPFDARFLFLNVHPIGVGIIFPLVALLGVFYSLAFLLRTGCTDPGIVPRAKPDEIEYMQALGDIDPNNTAKGYLGTPARYMTVMVRGQQIKLKWCPTCNIWRPPRASHCGLCNNCYELFDHHCPVVGNCVAKRNYRFFYLFLCSIMAMAVFIMGCNVAVIVIASKQHGFFNALKSQVASVIEFAIAGLAGISVTGLAFMHTWLIATMQTTNEDIKGTFKPERDGIQNPYKQRNCFTNFLMIVCGPTHPSLIDRRGLVDESMILEEEAIEGNGYGATTNSNIPKLPPESQDSTSAFSPTVFSSPTETAQLASSERAESSPEPNSPQQVVAVSSTEVQVEIHERQDSVSTASEDTQQLLGNNS